MASTVSYNLNLNTAQGETAIDKLYRKGQTLFGKGISVNVDPRSLSGFDRSLNQATARIISFTATTTLIKQTGNAFKRLASEAIEVQTAITSIQSILNATSTDLGKFTKSLFEIANKTGTSFFDAAAAANEFSRAGLSLEKTLQATAAALGVVRTSGGNVTDVVQGLISAVNSFSGENLGFNEVADKLSALDAAFSTSASGLIQAFGRVGVAAADAGVTFDELGGIISAVKQISGRSEAQIGNSFKAIFVSLQNEKIQALLEGVGVATKDANGEFRSSLDVLRDLAEAFKTLGDSQKAYIATKIGGKFQANAFQTTIQALQNGTAARGEGISAGADNNIAKRLALLNETTATTIQKFQNSITELSSTLGDAVGRNFVEGLLKYGNTGLDQLKKLFEDGNPLGSAISAGLSSAFTGPGIVLGAALLIKLSARVLKDTISSGRALLSNASTQEIISRALGTQLSLTQQINAATAAGVTLLQKRAKIPYVAVPQANPFQSNPAAAAVTQQARLVAIQKNLSIRRQNQANSAADAAARKAAVIQAARDQSQRRQNQFALGASFAVPAAFSAISSTLDDGAQKRQIDAVGQGLSTALIGSAFGPIGAAAGILAGSFQILSGITDELYGSLEDVNKTVREGISQNEKEKQAGELFVQAQKGYLDALETGKNSLIEKAARDREIAIQNLPDSRKGLLSFGSNIDGLTKEIDKLNSVSDRKSSGLSATSVAQQIVEETYKKSLIDKIGGISTKKQAQVSDADKITNEIVNSLDLQGVSQKLIDEALTGFGATGNSEKLQAFTNSLTANVSDASSAIKTFSDKFQNGAETISVSIAKSIQERIRRQRFSQIEQVGLKADVNFDKKFKEIISRALSEFGLQNASQQRDRGLNLSRLQRNNAGLTGQGRIEADAKEKLVEAQNAFSDALDTANTKFLPNLESALKDVGGQDIRSKVILSIQDILSKGFDKSQIQSVLEKTIGSDSAKSVLNNLNSDFYDFSIASRGAKEALDDQIKAIKEEVAARTAASKQFLGNPREDQTSLIRDIFKSRKDFLNPRGQDKNDPFNISSGASERSRAALKAIELERSSGINANSPKDQLEIAKKSFEQLINANRTDFGKQSANLAIDNLSQSGFSFGSGGKRSVEAFKQLTNKAIESQNFDSLTNSSVVKAASETGSPQAKEFIRVLSEIKNQSSEQPNAIKDAIEKFQKDNDVLQSIAQNTAETNSILRLKTNQNFLETFRPQDLVKLTPEGISSNNSRIDPTGNLAGLQGIASSAVSKISSLVGEEQRKLDSLKKDSASFKLDFNNNLSNFIQSNWAGVSNKQIENFQDGLKNGGIGNQAKFFGSGITQEESSTIKNIIEKGFSDRFELYNNILSSFPDKGKSGLSRGEEIKRAGALDPLLSDKANNKLNPNIEKSSSNKLSNLEANQNFIQKILSDSQTQTGKKLEETISILNKLVVALDNGVNQNLAANIGIDIKSDNKESYPGLSNVVRKYFIDFYTEANGKAPVLAPLAQ